MRITSFTIFNQLTRSLQERMQRMSVFSERLSSGKIINKPSDDPYAIAQAMDYKVSINEIEQYKKNIDGADGNLGLTDSIMSSVSTVLTRARELAVQAATGTQTASNRAAIAEEIAKLRDELLRLSGTKSGDRYIFSGLKTDTDPFNGVFAYMGDTSEMNVLVGRDSTVAVNVTGDEAFSYSGETYFETLDNLYNSLTSNDVTGVRTSITLTDNALTQVSNVRADIGARMNYIADIKTMLEGRDTSLKISLSNTEDSDIAGTVSELSKIQVALESLRASGAKVLSQSLLDFLR